MPRPSRHLVQAPLIAIASALLSGPRIGHRPGISTWADRSHRTLSLAAEPIPVSSGWPSGFVVVVYRW